ncbi:MAG: hypothetical protein QM706_10910 [Nitrospira sp.]
MRYVVLFFLFAFPFNVNAQQPHKPSDRPLSLNAKEQQDIHDHIVETIRLQSVWMTVTDEPTSEKRSRLFFEQILSNDWLSPHARPAFDKMLTPHVSNLRTMFPQVEQQARKELERRRQALPNASWLESDESQAVVRPVFYPNPPSFTRFLPSARAARDHDPHLTLVDGPMGGAMHSGGGSVTQSERQGIRKLVDDARCPGGRP